MANLNKKEEVLFSLFLTKITLKEALLAVYSNNFVKKQMGKLPSHDEELLENFKDFINAK